MPTSMLSSTWNLWRARRLVATSPLTGALWPCDFLAMVRDQVDAAARRLHPIDRDGDRIADPHGIAAPRAEQHGLGRVEFVALPTAHPPGGQEPLVDVGE